MNKPLKFPACSPKTGGIVLTVATLSYIAAVMQRSSIGVASLDATKRFEATAADLASLALWQVLVYALAQIPVGLLLDRIGPRKMLAIGAVVMGIGQLIVAFSVTLETAVAGRILVGLGDAFTFISLIRLINGWYFGRLAARLQQTIANVGQLGQIVSAFPFSALLGIVGWTSGFLTLSTTSFLLTALVLLIVRDNNIALHPKHESQAFMDALRSLRVSVRQPHVRMAFWTHFCLQSPAAVFALLWGIPFLVEAEGVTKRFAGFAVTAIVLVGIVSGVGFGWICARFPQFRAAVVFSMSGFVVVTWLLIIMQPNQAPIWMILALLLALGAAGSASMVAFDYSRQYVPLQRLGTSNGLINVGGFVASFVTMFMIGQLLDLARALHSERGADWALYGLDGFRFAMPAQIVSVLVGLSFYLREWLLVRRLERTPSVLTE